MEKSILDSYDIFEKIRSLGFPVVSWGGVTRFLSGASQTPPAPSSPS